MKPAATSSLVVVSVVLLGASVVGVGIVGTDGDAAIQPGEVGDLPGDPGSSDWVDQHSSPPSDGGELTALDDVHGDDSSDGTFQRYRTTPPEEDLQPDGEPGNGSGSPGDSDDSDDDSDDEEDEDGEDEDDGDDSDDDETEEDDDGSDDGSDENGWGDGQWWDSDDEETPTSTPAGSASESDDDEFDWGSPFGPSETPTPTRTPRETPTSSPASFRVADATLERDEVRVGESVAATATVENRADRAGTYEAEFRIDGEAVASNSVTVEAGDAQTVTVRTRVEQPGRYDVAVGDADAGTLSVTRPDADVLAVVDATLPADAVQPGVQTTVHATIENPADRAIDPTVNVTVDGERVAGSEVSLDPGERTEVTIPFEATGGTVAVGGVEAGQLQVEESVGGDEAAQPTPEEAAGFDLGFGLLAVAILVAGALLVAGSVRWRSDDSMLGNLEERRR